MYYFGCIGSAGHYFWHEGRKLWFGDLPDDFPEFWTFNDRNRGGTDRTYVSEKKIAPNCYGEQGLAQIGYCEGWTRISFPDRSVDHRPNCVSAFMERGHLSFEEMMVKAAEEFPSVVDRYEFEIKAVQ